MTKMQKLIEELDELNIDFKEQLSEESYQYYLELKKGKIFSSKGMTENGVKIISYMQENYEKYNNLFKAKEIGEGLFMSSRSISGSMRKLVADEYVEKTGNDPVVYSLTDKGKMIGKE